MVNPTLPIDETSDALAPAPKADPIVEALLQHADRVDVEKLRQIIDLQERILNRNAEQAFNAAFARMQPEIPTITERAKMDKTAYAPLEDIIDQVRPILARHGFTLSHRTEWPDKSTVKVIGILTHVEGHARTSEFVASADQTGSKNAIQALGSSVSYGKRYTTKDLLCIVTRHEDDDGQKGGRREPPDGYDDWWADLQAAADEGLDALEKAWKETKNKALKEYTVNHNRQAYQALKTRAAKV